MKTKRIIACIISCILFTVCIPFTATAKVIEPEVVKTEKWTASYFIDDNSDTLYPYIECQSNIYNDGTLDVIYYNTYDWDGFSTVSHYIVFPYTLPFEFNSDRYNNVKSVLETGKYQLPESHDLDSSYILNRCYIGNFTLNEKLFDLSYYPKEYTQSVSSSFTNYITDTDRYPTSQSDAYHSNDVTCEIDLYYRGNKSTTIGSRTEMYISTTYRCALCNLPTKEKRMWHIKFTPKVDPTGTYKFRLFGHDITITPELLSGNIVATPSTNGYQEITYNNGTSAIQIKTDIDISGIQNYIDKLEAEKATLRQENTELKNRINLLSTGTYGDVNGDNAVDIQDAQIILAYYTQKDVAMMDVPDLVTFGLNFGKV